MSMEDEVRSFLALLGGLEDGQFANECTNRTRELSLKLRKQAESLGKAKGELTIKLKFSADPTTVQIDGEIVMKEPKPARQRSVLWLLSNGALSNKNPKQQSLPLREVPPVPKAREAPEESAEPRSV